MKNKKTPPQAPPQTSQSVPTRFSFQRVVRSPLGLSLGVGLFAVALAALVMDRTWAQWNLPLMYEWDSINVLAIAKAGIERWWASGSDRLGAPGSLDLAYYPMPEYGQLLFIKIISMFGLDASETINGYFFFTFFLAAMVATLAMVGLGLSFPLAAAGALVFSLLPCHFWRGSTHMFVNGFYLVPALCYVLMDSRTFREAGEDLAARKHFRIACALSVLTPLINTYYSFFYCVLLGFVALFETCLQRSRIPVISAVKLLGCVVVGGVLGMFRSLPLYASHKLSFTRLPQDSEVYGLKITQMLLPAFSSISEHLRLASATYNTTAPLVNENHWNDLGLLTGIAFIVAMGAVFMGMLREKTLSDDANDALVRRAGLCAILSILYGTVGGISALFSYAVSPFIRSANRIEVYIAFFVLVISLRLLQTWLKGRLGERLKQPAVAFALVAVPAVVLFWDVNQKPDVRPQFAKSDPMYQRDREFFARLEASLPKGTRIYQVPQLPYPEAGLREVEYDHFRPYLHTDSLVWSFGAVRGTEVEQDNRRAEAWLMGGQHGLFKEWMNKHNFKGVLLDRKIAQMVRSNHEQVLGTLMGAPRMSDSIGEFVYYAME